ncbi:polysaccharide deacetylase family protein [Konateibacter massiliensis]|uniref:polysaccharide deacetylase family protein n=1 Tax=Konateibacter massiliensis TaxID=2002841 RepID=UPI000C1619D0|nr:polysaccharide deacetylase family protein [Konateibacter massiliensis]
MEEKYKKILHIVKNVIKDKTKGKITKKGVLAGAMLFLLAAGLLSTPRLLSVTTSGTASKKELPIYCVQTDKPQVALSFDAAWGNEDTGRILEILAKHNVKVTFFMTGGWIETYPEDVKKIAEAGHDLGNHSQNHKQMSKLSKAECMEEIQKPHDLVKELTGIDMFLFRPPYGDYNNTLVEAAYEISYYPIQWDVDSLDWKDYGADDIIKRVVNHKNLGNGSIILCHNGAKYTADALDSLITGLQDKGYELVPISQLIIKDNYYMNHEGRQCAN